MGRKKTNKERYNFLIDKRVYEEFSEFCGSEGIIRSKKIEQFIQQFIETHKDEMKKLKQKIKSNMKQID